MSQDATSLSGMQVLALAALVQGASITEAAAAAGVRRETVHRWLTDDPLFISEWNRARLEILDAARSEVRSLARLASAALRESLAPGAPPAIRLRAALAILESVGAMTAERIGEIDPAVIERQQQHAAHWRETIDGWDGMDAEHD